MPERQKYTCCRKWYSPVLTLDIHTVETQAVNSWQHCLELFKSHAGIWIHLLQYYFFNSNINIVLLKKYIYVHLTAVVTGYFTEMKWKWVHRLLLVMSLCQELLHSHSHYFLYVCIFQSQYTQLLYFSLLLDIINYINVWTSMSFLENDCIPLRSFLCTFDPEKVSYAIMSSLIIVTHYTLVSLSLVYPIPTYPTCISKSSNKITKREST